MSQEKKYFAQTNGVSKLKLDLETVIGFGGDVKKGLYQHPNKQHLLYPLGNTVVVRNLVVQGDTEFLYGHNGPITCLAVSSSGRYVVSGQSTHMGFKAAVIIWDFKTRKAIHKLMLHKVKVQSLAFSEDEKYLLSVGGQDDNNVTVWSVETGKPICGAVSSNLILCSAFFNETSTKIVTAGKYTLRVWDIDFENRKITPTDCSLGQLKRVITCLKLAEDDSCVYCGTTSGDLLCVQMQGLHKSLAFSGPSRPIPKGVLSIEFTSMGNILVGGGDGSLTVLQQNTLKRLKKVSLMGGVTTIFSTQNGSYYVGTSQSVMYHISQKMEATLLSTCHSTRINDIAYPQGTSEIIATCSKNDIRLWNALKGRELVRIQLPNLECNCVTFSPDGTQVISGWSDGRIRAFGPQSGKLLYVINEAHKISGQKKISGNLIGVTALAVTNDNARIISGGSDAQVRVWSISKSSQILIASMKEHKSTINCVVIRKDDTECVTASDDGSCIIWNLDRFIRSGIMYGQTRFKKVRYLDDESQIVSAGSDKNITYWDAYNCSEIRELGASSDEIHALDLSPDGETFVCGGSDKLVSLWDYDEGEKIVSAAGHSGDITMIKYSPDGKFICSVGSSGAVLLWKVVKA